MNKAALIGVANHILSEEGGIADVGDGKGLTRWGQTRQWLDQWGLPTPESIYDARENYCLWLIRSGLEHVCSIPDALALAVVDWAVNSGEEVAIEALQRAVGAVPDGLYGPQTRGAVELCDRSKVAAKVIAARLEFLATITVRDPSRLRFLKGWLRRVGRLVQEIPQCLN